MACMKLHKIKNKAWSFAVLILEFGAVFFIS